MLVYCLFLFPQTSYNTSSSIIPLCWQTLLLSSLRKWKHSHKNFHLVPIPIYLAAFSLVTLDELPGPLAMAGASIAFTIPSRLPMWWHCFCNGLLFSTSFPFPHPTGYSHSHNHTAGQEFGIMVKLSILMPAIRIRVPEFKFWMFFWFQLLDHAHPGRQVMTQILGP